MPPAMAGVAKSPVSNLIWNLKCRHTPAMLGNEDVCKRQEVMSRSAGSPKSARLRRTGTCSSGAWVYTHVTSLREPGRRDTYAGDRWFIKRCENETSHQNTPLLPARPMKQKVGLYFLFTCRQESIESFLLPPPFFSVKVFS